MREFNLISRLNIEWNASSPIVIATQRPLLDFFSPHFAVSCFFFASLADVFVVIENCVFQRGNLPRRLYILLIHCSAYDETVKWFSRPVQHSMHTRAICWDGIYGEKRKYNFAPIAKGSQMNDSINCMSCFSYFDWNIPSIFNNFCCCCCLHCIPTYSPWNFPFWNTWMIPIVYQGGRFSNVVSIQIQRMFFRQSKKTKEITWTKMKIRNFYFCTNKWNIYTHFGPCDRYKVYMFHCSSPEFYCCCCCSILQFLFLFYFFFLIYSALIHSIFVAIAWVILTLNDKIRVVLMEKLFLSYRRQANCCWLTVFSVILFFIFCFNPNISSFICLKWRSLAFFSLIYSHSFCMQLNTINMKHSF